MILPNADHDGPQVPALGLGCSRLGSIMGASKREAEEIIAQAVDLGITFFDTASSYGQGDSERILGRIVGENDKICITTKVGKLVPLRARVLQPVKGVVRMLARHSNKAGTAVKQSRGGTLPVCFDNSFLERELDSSRRRLGLSCIPMVMLHSPSAAVLLRGDAVGFLDNARGRGTLQVVGAAVDNIEAAEATLGDPRITAVQVPFYENDDVMAEWAIRAKEAGKLVVAREIFHGIQSVPDASNHIRRNLQRVFSSEGVSVSLVGTTKSTHLSEIMAIAEAGSRIVVSST